MAATNIFQKVQDNPLHALGGVALSLAIGTLASIAVGPHALVGIGMLSVASAILCQFSNNHKINSFGAGLGIGGLLNLYTGMVKTDLIP